MDLTNKNLKTILSVSFAVLILFLVVQFFKKPTQTFENKFYECSDGATSRIRMDCFSKSFESFFLKDGLPRLLSQLQDLTTKDDHAEGGGITKCHDAAHSIGMLAGMYTTDLQSTFTQCTNLCGFGCHMGVLEGYFDMHPSEIENFPAICRASSHPYSCVHAVGHFVSHQTGNLEKSLATCDQIPEEEYRGHCTSGVFMELFEQPIHSDTSFQMPQNLTLLCNSLSGVHKSFCLTMSGFYTYLATTDFNKGIETCLKSPEKNVCFNNYSKALYYRQNGDAQKMFDFCKIVPEEFLGNCQEGVTTASILSDPVIRHGFEFCDLYQGANRQNCFTKIGSYVQGSFGGSSAEKERICKTIHQDDQKFCLGN